MYRDGLRFYITVLYINLYCKVYNVSELYISTDISLINISCGTTWGEELEGWTWSWGFSSQSDRGRDLFILGFNNSVRSNNLSLKYERVKPTGCRDIEIRKFEVVAKTQFLWDEFSVEIYNFQKTLWSRAKLMNTWNTSR